MAGLLTRDFRVRAFPFLLEQWLKLAQRFRRLQLRGQWRILTAFPKPSLVLSEIANDCHPPFTGASHAPE